MDHLNIYESIAERTQGDIYIGVVGPVRTGKSTFIKRFMDLMVIPNVENVYVKERVKDEVPQSGAGKTIMTTEPKFVPNEAVEITLAENSKLKVRLVDCVGYMVPGAIGHMEDGKPRMVSTPWSPTHIPFEEAAEIGTRKVISDHSTIGLVITTDGSIAEIERNNYIQAEDRVIKELKDLNKPFIVVLNSIFPESERAIELKKDIEEKYGVPVIAANCARMNINTVNNILESILFQFPVSQINFRLPGWIDGLSKEHWIKEKLIERIKDWSYSINNIRDVQESVVQFKEMEIIKESNIKAVNLGSGIIDVGIDTREDLFYQVLEEITGYEVKGDYQFFEMIKSFAYAKKEYDKIKEALNEVKETGYGMVPPDFSNMELEDPEIFRQGSRFGVRLRAKAPSLHIIRTDIFTEVAPIVGSEKQSEDLTKYLLEEFETDPSRIWTTNIFGKSLNEVVSEQMQSKLVGMPYNVRVKMQKTLQKIVNDGKGNFICIII
ncbi:MAG: stage IV sporulation protein A [Clostridiales bacterium]|nr:stage IV sporulation protein A [Clostridiales bacterium]